MPRRARMKPGRRRASTAMMTGAQFAGVRVRQLEMTQVALAERMGLTSTTISNLERGASPISASRRNHLLSIMAEEASKKLRAVALAAVRGGKDAADA